MRTERRFSLTQCSSNVPENERCCPQFNNCEVRRISEYIGIREDIPRYLPQNIPAIDFEPLFKHDYNLCIGCLRCVRVCQDVRGVGALGFVYKDGNVVVGSVAPSFNESSCKFCGACVEVCPTGALTDKTTKGTREETVVPCQHTCPGGIHIPRYVRLIADGKYAEAAAVIREKVPFPAVLGRVCFHPCEDVCHRMEINESISICALKRFAAGRDTGLWKTASKVADATGKKIAIVGSGPAGLTAAYYLTKLGHKVTVFDALPEPGGMMRVGIPEYRLPRNELDAEIEEIKSIGVEIKTNTKVESIDSLFEQGYNAVFVATGAHQGTKIGVKGEDSERVLQGVDILRDVNLGNAIELGNRIAIIGGGNVAIDTSRVARRLGAEEVTIVYRRTKAEMPASAHEIEAALNEGINIEFLAAPAEINKSNGKIQLTCIRMKLGEPDESGRARPVPIENSEFTVEFDNVISSIGQSPEVPAGFGLDLERGNVINVRSDSLATNIDGVFAGGDAVTGPASVIEAIAAGRQAAISIDKYLGGNGNIEEELIDTGMASDWLGRDEGFGDWHRVAMRSLPVKECLEGFNEVELGFNEEEAISEAKRCLNCLLRLHIPPTIMPPEEWLTFDEQTVSAVPENEGVFQLLDEDKNIIYIKGAMNMLQELQEQLETGEDARYFSWEEDPMYTKRESELIQQFLQKHGKLPALNDDLGDLF
jgi:NADPH-dependent glutamate synthase beta subunit-like oxidoreductase/Pyruvate/2-oxoacid:ferredoxin oxidoreductase delta subunit